MVAGRSRSDTQCMKPREIQFFIRMPDGQQHVCQMAGDATVAILLAKYDLSGSILSHLGRKLDKSATIVENYISDNQSL